MSKRARRRQRATTTTTAASSSCAVEPTDNDVLCGRRKKHVNSVGNVRFRNIVAEHIRDYIQAGHRRARSLVVNKVIQRIHDEGGRFLKQNRNGWYDGGMKAAKQKTGHSLRDAIIPDKIKCMSAAHEAMRQQMKMTTKKKLTKTIKEKMKDETPPMRKDKEEKSQTNETDADSICSQNSLMTTPTASASPALASPSPAPAPALTASPASASASSVCLNSQKEVTSKSESVVEDQTVPSNDERRAAGGSQEPSVAPPITKDDDADHEERTGAIAQPVKSSLAATTHPHHNNNHATMHQGPLNASESHATMNHPPDVSHDDYHHHPTLIPSASELLREFERELLGCSTVSSEGEEFMNDEEDENDRAFHNMDLEPLNGGDDDSEYPKWILQQYLDAVASI